MPGTRFQKQTRPRQVTTIEEAHEAIREAHESIEEMRAVEHMDSRILTSTSPEDRTGFLSFTPGTILKISHGLGRAFRGYQRMDLIADGATGEGTIVRVTQDGSGNFCDESKEIWLKALGFPTATVVKAKISVY